MKPTLVQFEAEGWGVGELWLDDDGRVFHSELPRPTRVRHKSDVVEGFLEGLAHRMEAWFDGAEDDLLDVPVVMPTGFHRACADALRATKRGETITYGELAALAGRPRAARAAGTFCARCELVPFLPVHRVVAAGGIGSWGAQGVEVKKRLLELEGAL